MNRLCLFGCLILMFGIPSHAISGVYKWIDDSGNVHYGDSPPDAVQSKEMELRMEQSDSSGEDKLRRQRLLKDDNVRSKRRSEKHRQQNDGKLQRVLADAQCMDLRRQLDLLQYQMPVYKDEKGQYRVKWAEDVYQGKREYIDDSTRTRVINNIRAQIDSRCAHQDAARAQKAARTQNYMSEKCKAARVELEILQRPSARATDDELEEKKNKVRAYCRN